MRLTPRIGARSGACEGGSQCAGAVVFLLALVCGADACVTDATIPPAGSCGAQPCWKRKGTPPGSRGHGYRDPAATADGIETLRLKPDPAGASSITLKARGPHLALSTLPSALPLRVQLSADGGACWEARYDATGVHQHDVARLEARGE